MTLLILKWSPAPRPQPLPPPPSPTPANPLPGDIVKEKPKPCGINQVCASVSGLDQLFAALASQALPPLKPPPPPPASTVLPPLKPPPATLGKCSCQ